MTKKKSEQSSIVKRFFEKREKMRSVYGWLGMGEMQYVMLVDPVNIEKSLNYGLNREVDYKGGYVVKPLGNNVYLVFNEYYSDIQKESKEKPNWIINGIEIYSPRYLIFETDEFDEIVDLSDEKFNKIKIEKP